MNSCRQSFKKLVLGTTLMCCAGMSTVEAGLRDWLYENRGKVCLLVGVVGTAVGVTCYHVFWKPCHSEPFTTESGLGLSPQDDAFVVQGGGTTLEGETQNEEQALTVKQTKEQVRAKWVLLFTRERKVQNRKAAFRMLQEDLEQYRTQLVEIGQATGNDNSNASPRKRGIPDVVSSLVATNKCLSETIRNNSETIRLQEENIKNLIIVIQNGQRIAMEILKKCRGNFVSEVQCEFNLSTLERENRAFLQENTNFLAVTYEPKKGEESESEIKNLESSLNVWNQCLQGVTNWKSENEMAVQKAQEEAKEAGESLRNVRAENEGLFQANKLLQEAKDKAEQQMAQAEKEKEEASKQAAELQNQNKVLTKTNATTAKEILVVKEQLRTANERTNSAVGIVKSAPLPTQVKDNLIKTLEKQQ